jgi:hypothetical protein
LSPAAGGATGAGRWRSDAAPGISRDIQFVGAGLRRGKGDGPSAIEARDSKIDALRELRLALADER